MVSRERPILFATSTYGHCEAHQASTSPHKFTTRGRPPGFWAFREIYYTLTLTTGEL
jgi:hypothetical protein